MNEEDRVDRFPCPECGSHIRRFPIADGAYWVGVDSARGSTNVVGIAIIVLVAFSFGFLMGAIIF